MSFLFDDIWLKKLSKKLKKKDMKKNKFRETLKSFFEPHFDHEKGEMLKGTKTGNFPTYATKF